jgi:hypothetical protein
VQLLIVYFPSPHTEEQLRQLLWPVTFWYSSSPQGLHSLALVPAMNVPSGHGMH